MKPVDIKSSKYFDYIKEINDEDPKFEIGDIVRTSKCKNVFAKDYVPNWSVEVFIIKKIKSSCRHMSLVILKAKKSLERFTKKNCERQIKKSLELKQ